MASVLEVVLWNRGGSHQAIPVSLNRSASGTSGIPSDLPSWPFTGGGFCLGVAVWFAVGYLRGLGLRLLLAKSQGRRRFLAGRTVVRSYRCSQVVSHASLSCVGAPSRPVADGGVCACPGSVAVVLDGSEVVRRFQSRDRWRRRNSSLYSRTPGGAFRQHHDSSSGNWTSPEAPIPYLSVSVCM